jgi:murein DD-endopeptidase MepM/ murein hydrolase activator NlpD
MGADRSRVRSTPVPGVLRSAAKWEWYRVMPSVTARGQRTGVSRSMIVVLVFVVLLVVPVAAPPGAAGASLKDQIAAQKERQQDLAKSISKSQKIVESLQRDESRTRTDLAQTQEDLKDIRADQKTIAARIDKVAARLERIKARHAVLVEEQRQTDFTLGLLEQELVAGEDDLKARRESLGQRLVEASRTDSTTLLTQVFTADSFSDVLTDTSAFLAYGEQDAQLAEQIIDDQRALDNLRLLTTSTRLHTDQLRRDTLETQNQVKELNKQLRDAKRQLARLKSKTEKIKDRQEAQVRLIVKNKKQAVAIVKKQQAARNTLMRSIAAKTRSLQAKAARQFGIRGGSGSGRFAWPTSGSISQPYGCTGYYYNPPRGSCTHFHDGIDIANRAGTPILAADNGVVAFIGWNPYEATPAFLVVIAHGGGLSTLYAHMQPTYPVRVGQVVRRGQRVGSMGNTGGSFGSHLHFEVWRGDWSPINPYAYL